MCLWQAGCGCSLSAELARHPCRCSLSLRWRPGYDFGVIHGLVHNGHGFVIVASMLRHEIKMCFRRVWLRLRLRLRLLLAPARARDVLKVGGQRHLLLGTVVCVCVGTTLHSRLVLRARACAMHGV